MTVYGPSPEKVSFMSIKERNPLSFQDLKRIINTQISFVCLFLLFSLLN